jgi:hypothetical protein
VLEADFANILELRSFESFSLRSLKNKKSDSLFHAELVYYWSEDTIITYNLDEILVQEEYPTRKDQKRLKINIYITSTEDIIQKFQNG